jgi:hypothetical protein
MYHGYWARKKPALVRYLLDRKSRVWNVSSLRNERELAKYRFKWKYERPGGTRMALNQQMCVFFYRNGNENQLHNFSYIRETQQLRS